MQLFRSVSAIALVCSAANTSEMIPNGFESGWDISGVDSWYFLNGKLCLADWGFIRTLDHFHFVKGDVYMLNFTARSSEPSHVGLQMTGPNQSLNMELKVSNVSQHHSLTFTPSNEAPSSFLQFVSLDAFVDQTCLANISMRSMGSIGDLQGSHSISDSGVVLANAPQTSATVFSTPEMIPNGFENGWDICGVTGGHDQHVSWYFLNGKLCLADWGFIRTLDHFHFIKGDVYMLNFTAWSSEPSQVGLQMTGPNQSLNMELKVSNVSQHHSLTFTPANEAPSSFLQFVSLDAFVDQTCLANISMRRIGSSGDLQGSDSISDTGFVMV